MLFVDFGLASPSLFWELNVVEASPNLFLNVNNIGHINTSFIANSNSEANTHGNLTSTLGRIHAESIVGSFQFTFCKM